ncbi:MAG: serine hydrolase domain-containing protein [Sphingobacterium sp.]
MKIIRISVAFVFLLIHQVSQPILYAQSAKEKVVQFLSDAMKKEYIPGLAYAVIDQGTVKIKGTLGLADLTWNQAVSSQTAFQLASVSKIYTGALLARLFDKGVLAPQTTLSELIKEIPDTWKNITVLQLANHQSGIKMGNFSEAKNSDEALEIAKKQPLLFAPGESENYVSSDYWILQYIIEHVTGKSYFEALKEYVTIPLGMNHTFVDQWQSGYVQFAEVIPQKATVYHAANNPDRYIEGFFPFVATGYAAGGLYSSLDDMVKLQCALLDSTFISRTNAVLINSGTPMKSKMGTFGLGTMVYNYDGHKVFGHTGGPALADVCTFEKEGITVIILTNQRGFYPYLAKSVASFYIPGLSMEKPPGN